MREFFIGLGFIWVMVIVLVGCENSRPKVTYPSYELKKISYIPDSLKPKYREFITETVRAASQHMTGGDYEDADDTIHQAEQTGKRAFSVEVLGLAKKINGNYWDNIEILPSEFTPYEQSIFDKLTNPEKVSE